MDWLNPRKEMGLEPYSFPQQSLQQDFANSPGDNSPTNPTWLGEKFIYTQATTNSSNLIFDESPSPPCASTNGMDGRPIAAANTSRFMMNVLEALHMLHTKEGICAKFSTQKIIDFVSRYFIVDGDVEAQVRTALRLAHVSGLVKYFQNGGTYTLLPPTIGSMQASQRRYKRFLKKRRELADVDPCTMRCDSPPKSAECLRGEGASCEISCAKPHTKDESEVKKETGKEQKKEDKKKEAKEKEDC